MKREELNVKYCLDASLKINKINMPKLNAKGGGPGLVSLEYDGKKYDVRVNFVRNTPILALPKGLALSKPDEKNVVRAVIEYGKSKNLFSKNYLVE